MIRHCRPAPRRHDPRRRRVGCRQRRRQYAGAEISASGAHHRRRARRGRGLQGRLSEGRPIVGSRPTGRCRSPTRSSISRCPTRSWSMSAAIAASGGIRPRTVPGGQNGSSSACRTGISRSSITPRSRCCISGREASGWACRLARQGGLGGREQSDFDVAAAPRRAGARRGGAPVIGHTGIMLGAVQLQPVSVHHPARIAGRVRAGRPTGGDRPVNSTGGPSSPCGARGPSYMSQGRRKDAAKR